MDRRVELFFFGGDEEDLGIQPKPPGKNSGPGSTQYPEWRARSRMVFNMGPGGPRVLRIRVADDALKPYEGKRYHLQFEGHDPMDGITAGEGIIEVLAPPDGTKGHVTVYPDDQSDELALHWELLVGSIKGPETPEGASVRLANLSYYFGPVVDTLTDELQEAISCFQFYSGTLEVNGALDPPTVKELRWVHDGIGDDGTVTPT